MTSRPIKEIFSDLVDRTESSSVSGALPDAYMNYVLGSQSLN